MRTKILSILSIFLVAAFMVAPASAVSSATVSTTATVPSVLSFTIDKTALTFNLNVKNEYIRATESPLSIQNVGNTPFILFGKLASLNSGIDYKADSNNILDLTDKQIGNSADFAVGAAAKSIVMEAKAADSVGPGSYTNTITLSAIGI